MNLSHNANQLTDATKAVQSKTDDASTLKQDIDKIRTRIEKEVSGRVDFDWLNVVQVLTMLALVPGGKCRGYSDYHQEFATNRS
jgi:hypothetical protein